MLNQVILVGRLAKKPEVINEEEKRTIIELAIPRSFKNKDGEYEIDYVNCILMGLIAKNTTEYCQKGDIIGVKGHISTEIINEDGNSKKRISVVAEKITFLSTKKNND